jgi:endonuclease/exonuclease/phosphatase family metal-dependent hydrolase
MKQARFLGPAVSASVALFYVQTLRVAFSVLFGVIYDQIFEGPMTAWLAISNVLLIAALLAPAIAPRMPARIWLGVAAIVTALARILLTINDAQVRYWSALVILAAAGIYLGSLMARARKEVFRAIVIALVLDQVLRIAGDTYDLSLRPAWLIPQVLWSALVVLAAIVLLRVRKEDHEKEGGLSLAGGLALGGFVFVETSLLALPNGIARWTASSYAVVAPLLLAVSMLPLVPKLWRPRWLRSLGVRIGLGVIAAVGLLLGYFYAGLGAAIILIVVQALMLAGLAHLLLNPLARLRRAGSALAVGMLLFLVLNFLNAFAFTYPYTLPEMRGMGWVVYLVALLLFGLGVMLHRAGDEAAPGVELRSWWAALAGCLALLVAVISAWPKAADPLPDDGTLRLATYNIHYGYDDVWHLTLEDQVRAIRAEGVDVIAMQEVDTGRMTSYGVDNAYFLARQLGMNAAYLPAVEHLTGIAVLYRGPLAPTADRLLTSLQEQTGIIGVSLQTAAGDLAFYGVWMGLSDEDTQLQIDEALEFIGDSSPAAFGGDFNSRPDEAVTLSVLEAGLIEPFVALGQDPAPPTSPAINPGSQIDYVFLRGLLPMDAWVAEALSSDHRMVVVEVGWSR